MVKRRGFSLIEMLIALSISATLLAATLSALDASFKSYEVTSESASTHVVSRIVTHRVLTMIRTGTDFAPYPSDVLDPAQNPIVADYIEFVSGEDESAGTMQVTRIERQTDDEAGDGTFLLAYRIFEMKDGAVVSEETRPLIRGLKEASFTLEYDIGPVLRRATMDLTIQPNDLQDAKISSDQDAPLIRLVSSTSPRQLEDF